MDTELQDKILTSLKSSWLPIAFGIFGLIFFAYGLMQILGQNSSSDDQIEFTTQAQNENRENNSDTVKKIVVDVQGAVLTPGVYSLENDARIQDALIQAGGLTEKANRAFIAKSINLAAKVTDGQKIYIPFEGEQTAGVGIDSSVLNSLININTGSQNDLESLPGIGPVTAEKIMSLRPYSSVEDLVNKKAVSQAIFEKIKDLITAN